MTTIGTIDIPFGSPLQDQQILGALARAAGRALAVVARDGRVLRLDCDQRRLAATLGPMLAARWKDWLEGTDWTRELVAGEVFEQADRDGMVLRGAELPGGDGTLVEQTIVPLAPNEPGGPMLVAMNDTPDWRRYAFGIERLSRFYEVMLNTAGEGILGISDDGRIDFANPAAAGLLGWSVEDLLGQGVGDALGSGFRLPVANGTASEAGFQRRDGTAFLAETRVSSIQDDDAQGGVVMVFSDITARKEAEWGLADSNRRLTEALAALETTQQHLYQAEKTAAIARLAAGVAHGIDDPITYLRANLSTLDDYVRDLTAMLDERLAGADDLPGLEFLRLDVPELIGESLEGIARVNRIVKSLWVFSQVDLDQEWRELDLKAGLESALTLLEPEIPDEVEVQMALGPLPPVECQAGQVNQILLNLLSNALRAVGSDGAIMVSGGSDHRRVWVEVADDGCGIHADDQERIFQLPSSLDDQRSGLGLGLAVARGVLRHHGGDLSVTSAVGEGSVFRLELPVKPTVEGTPPAEAAAAGER